MRCPPELLIDFAIDDPLPERVLQVDAGSPLAADITWNQSLVHLMGGDLRAGLPMYEARQKLPRFSLRVPRDTPITLAPRSTRLPSPNSSSR